jgi:molecular chaperone DnaK
MIDSILLIGGTSCMPLVKQMLSDYFGVNKVLIDNKPELLKAKGAAILSYRLGMDEEKFESNSSYSTNHNYFIVNQTKDAGFDFRKIIEKQMPLPICTSITYKKQHSDEIVKHLEIFVDVEGRMEKMFAVLIYFSRYIPSGTELIIEISLDKNEIFKCMYWHIKGENDRHKAIITRGNRDARCLSNVEQIINSIKADNLSKKEKGNSINHIRRLLNRYDITNIESPMSNVWSEIDFKIKNYYDEISKN